MTCDLCGKPIGANSIIWRKGVTCFPCHNEDPDVRLREQALRIEFLERRLQEVSTALTGAPVHVDNLIVIAKNCREHRNSFIRELKTLIEESEGVARLHQNGDVASWEWLMDNGWLDCHGLLDDKKTEGC